MLNFTRIAAIATNTVREAVRSRVLYVLLFFAIAVMLFGSVLASLSYVESDRILQDIAMGAMRAFGGSRRTGDRSWSGSRTSRTKGTSPTHHSESPRRTSWTTRC